MLSRDLDMYVTDGDDGDTKFDHKFLEDIAKARDETLATIKKQQIITAIIFLFLLSSYFSVGLDINIAGISLKQSPGVPEALLLISNLLGCYTLILQGNCHLLDSTIRSTISHVIPEELRTIYTVRYFPHEHIGGYRAVNLPHILPTKITSRITSAALLLYLSILVFSALAFMAVNVFLLIHYLWLKPNFGIWSYLLLAYILLCGLSSFLYVAITRFRLPYSDFTANDELELLRQVNPERYHVRLQEMYGKLNQDRREMEKRGFIKAQNPD
jgi:hypothetical protein